MKGYRISLIRHGQTAANEKGIYIGRTDYPLSEKGRSELAAKLDEFEYPKVQRVYSSPLRRCMETAEILFPYRELLTVPDLQEMDFGDFEGKDVSALIDREDYKQWLKGGLKARPPKGESMEEVCVRTYKALHEIIMDMMNEGITHSGVVTHAGIITNMLSCFGLPKIDRREIVCAPGEGFEIIVTAKMWQQSQAFEILGLTPYTKEEEDLFTEEEDSFT